MSKKYISLINIDINDWIYGKFWEYAFKEKSIELVKTVRQI